MLYERDLEGRPSIRLEYLINTDFRGFVRPVSAVNQKYSDVSVNWWFILLAEAEVTHYIRTDSPNSRLSLFLHT